MEDEEREERRVDLTIPAKEGKAEKPPEEEPKPKPRPDPGQPETRRRPNDD